MALIWKETDSTPAPVKHGFSWDAWYAKNKTQLLEKRAKRYREDAGYREAALERSRKQREAKKVQATGPYTVAFSDAADLLGITVWVLREWRRKNYFPEPHRREGRLWFSPSQVTWLRTLQQFFVQHGPRTSEGNRSALEALVSTVYCNW